ncbi:putative RNA-directed DNA polymerase, eukaryota, reverse transcriptase zinc-binding domain protein [Tanacetum coccineum]
MQEPEYLQKLELMDMKEISNGLRNHARRCLEPKDIKSSFLDFYKGKLSFYDSSVFFPPMLPAHRLSIVDREFLESMVSMVEIKATVWDCGSQKAPRPDGYSFMFIKNFWNRLKHDIQSFFGLFFSLLIVAKILANRLSKVIDSIISPEQYALITGRQILDGPLILKVPSYVLDRLGFGIKWRNRIKAGLTSARSSILINESPTSEFSLKRGLRQEDPLSPFLFIIIMEDLHMALNDGLAANMFHGVKVGSQGMHLSHLFYVDNDIIFSEWNLNAMENIIWILNIFYIASGLKIKIHRSNVYGVGVSSNEVDIMASYTGCEDGFFPFTYLGLPIGLIMSCITNWQPLIDRFKVRLSGWKANILSIGGCLILIKYVLSSLAPKTPRSLLGWCLFHNSNALWVHVVKTIHGDEASIDIRGCHTNVDWSRPINVGRTKAEFDALISDIASLEPEKFVDSDTCIWSLSHDNKFSVNSVKKHIDELSLPSLSPNIDSVMCPVCNVSVESSAHTFFSCDTSSAIWHLVREWGMGKMWMIFKKYRPVFDMFMAKRRIRNGQRYGFIRYKFVRDVEILLRQLQRIKIGADWLRVFVAYDRRNNGNAEPRKGNVRMESRGNGFVETRESKRKNGEQRQ